MKCIYCNTPLAAIDYCTGCGADITIQKRIVRISNLLYNEGLEKARVRDMEGAITCLKRSLKFNKENIPARNLLGLCYYETGEAVSALCEWVVSKNLQPEDNLADHYIDALQNNKNRLDTINQSIRKYNQSVLYCREDNEDMAIIQLKKVISHNAKFVKAYQLLALLYMKRQEYERARKLLKKAAQIDNTNTTTLRYLQEIEEVTGKSTSLQRKHKKYEKEQEETISGTLRYMSGTEMIIQPTTFRDSSTIATFINIILGILLGGAIVWFLAVPASRQAVNDQANRTVTDANTKLAAESVKVQELQDQIDDYVQQAKRADQDRDEAENKTEKYDELLAIVNIYLSGDQTQAANLVAELDEGDYTGNAKALFTTLNTAAQASLYDTYYTEGTVAYVANDYATAAELLQKAVDADPSRSKSNHYDAMLYLGMAYYQLGTYAKSDEIFKQIIEYYPNKATEVASYITGSDGTPAGSSAADLSGVDEAVTVYDDPQEDLGDPIHVWTDPTTGLKYDQYGQLMADQ